MNKKEQVFYLADDEEIEQAKKDVQDIAEDVAQNLAEAQRDIEAATEDLGRKEE